MKLYFIVNWGGQSRERAWSGTNYSIYKALSKVFEIHEIQIKTPWIVNKIANKLRLDWFSREWYVSRFRRVENVKRGIVFQFGEVLKETKTRHTYVYQDLSVSYVKYMRDNLPDVFKVSAYQNAKSHIIDKRAMVQNSYYESCSGIFTMGHWLEDFLVSQGLSNDKVHAVGAGINVRKELINPQEKTHSKILFVGRDFKRKGGFVTYEAFKILKEQGENVELYVSGPKSNPIENPVEGYHFMGDLDYEQVAELYNKCDIFCMPSYFEAYGLVFIEALSFGLPCIGRDCYEMPYFIKDGVTGRLLKKDDPHLLAVLMSELLRDERIKKNVLDRRQWYLDTYSWDKVADRMGEFIKKDLRIQL